MVIDKIKKYHLCLGCGLCSSVLGHDKCKMELTKEGFFEPYLYGHVDDSVVKKICPGIKVHGNVKGELWGRFSQLLEGWACDNEIRFHSSSGGVVSALAVFLIEEKIVDAVLQVGVSSDNYLKNELKVSKSRKKIVGNAQSRYAPALTLFNIKQILEDGDEIYAFVGKGCDIAGVKNLLKQYPQYRNRFKLFISIICAGMPSQKGTEKAWGLSGKIVEPVAVKYRGDGWPGYFEAFWDDGSIFKLSYHESWGKVLSGLLNFRCKVCADGIGTLADISVGDSWCTKDGYPDFEEQEGKCLVFIRTKQGSEVISAAKLKGYINIHPIDESSLSQIQPGQYQRRKYAGWRLFPVQIASWFFLDFHNLGIIKQAFSANYVTGIKNMTGTLRRMMKLNSLLL